jgi:hypothetical protein
MKFSSDGNHVTLAQRALAFLGEDVQYRFSVSTIYLGVLYSRLITISLSASLFTILTDLK